MAPRHAVAPCALRKHGIGRGSSCERGKNVARKEFNGAHGFGVEYTAERDLKRRFVLAKQIAHVLDLLDYLVRCADKRIALVEIAFGGLRRNGGHQLVVAGVLARRQARPATYRLREHVK